MLTDKSHYTDDTVMTLAIAEALLSSKAKNYTDLADCAILLMRDWGNKYPEAGYGGMFTAWLHSEFPAPYNSFGNGAAMRVSACGCIAESVDEAKRLAHMVIEVTHNHPYAIKAAEAVASSVYMSRHGFSMSEIRKNVISKYYNINFTLSNIRECYKFDVTCQGSVPQAFQAFFESRGFIDAIRNAVSIGGDSDTIAAITGSIAWEYYAANGQLSEQDLDLWHGCLSRLDNKMLRVLQRWYGNNKQCED